MGITKGGGFPYPISFNPIGYKTSGNPLAPLKKCGMIQYSKGSTDGVLIDKIGKSTRDAVQGRTLVGNGQTYATFNEPLISGTDDFVIECNVSFNALGSSEGIYQQYSSGTTGRMYLLKRADNTIEVFFNTLAKTARVTTSLTVAIGQVYKIKCGRRNGTELYLEVDDVTIGTDDILATDEIEQKNSELMKFSSSDASNANILSFSLDEYNLNIEERQSTGILSLNGSDGTKKLLQQYLSPATATVVNNTVESAYDRLGGSIAKALGDNLFNKDAETDNSAISWTSGNPFSEIKSVSSDFILLENNTEYSTNYNSQVLFYDKDKVYLGALQNGKTTIAKSSGDDRVTNFTNLESFNATYVRFGYRESTNGSQDMTLKTDIMANTGSTALPYSAYLGYTMNQAGTIYFEDGTPIPCGTDGLLMGYVNGVRVAPEYSGRVRYNRVVCDVSGTPTGGEITPTGYIKLADNYTGITKYDTNRIQTETDGTGKVLPIADMLHVTNNQQFASEDKKDIGFYDKALTGDCKNKAIAFFKQGEQLTDQNGDLTFDAQGNALFTLKPWVTN